MKKKELKIWVITDFIEKITLERYLLNAIPKNRHMALNNLTRLTNLKIGRQYKFIKSDLFQMDKKSITITDKENLLSYRANNYIKLLIKKYIIPNKYKNEACLELNDFAGFLEENIYSDKEKEFIDFIFNNCKSIASLGIDTISIKNNPKLIKNLLNFNLVNNSCFRCIAKKIYSDILHNKIHAGDSIKPYIEEIYKNEKKYDESRILIEKLYGNNNNNNEIIKRLELSNIYDYYFDENAILRCDLETNRNIFIKNFINTIISEFIDIFAKMLILVNLQKTYPILIEDKIFNELN